METAVAAWGTPLQVACCDAKCTVLGGHDAAGCLRACTAGDFFEALELCNQEDGSKVRKFTVNRNKPKKRIVCIFVTNMAPDFV